LPAGLAPTSSCSQASAAPAAEDFGESCRGTERRLLIAGPLGLLLKPLPSLFAALPRSKSALLNDRGSLQLLSVGCKGFEDMRCMNGGDARTASDRASSFASTRWQLSSLASKRWNRSSSIRSSLAVASQGPGTGAARCGRPTGTSALSPLCSPTSRSSALKTMWGGAHGGASTATGCTMVFEVAGANISG